VSNAQHPARARSERRESTVKGGAPRGGSVDVGSADGGSARDGSAGGRFSGDPFSGGSSGGESVPGSSSTVSTVGVVTSSYPQDRGDFAGWFVRARAETWAQAGTPVQVVCGGAPGGFLPQGSRRPGGWKTQLSRAGGVEILRLPSWLYGGSGVPEMLETHGLGRGGLEGLRWVLGLSQIVAEQARVRSWSRAESHWLVPAALAVAVAAPGLPHQAFCHSGDLALLERLPLGRAVARFIVSRSDRVVCVSRDLAERLAACLGSADRRIVVEPLDLGLAGGSERNIRPTSGPMSDAISGLTPVSLMPTQPAATGVVQVIAVGRLVPVKGFAILIHALGRLPRWSRPALRLVGDGPLKEALRDLARRCRVDLTLEGQLPRSQVVALLRQSSLCVVPSVRVGAGRTEGMPLVAREALALGLPVVASAVGGLKELARANPRLCVVPPSNPTALAGAIQKMLLQITRAEVTRAKKTEGAPVASRHKPTL